MRRIRFALRLLFSLRSDESKSAFLNELRSYLLADTVTTGPKPRDFRAITLTDDE